jgi:hypothetical protein
LLASLVDIVLLSAYCDLFILSSGLIESASYDSLAPPPGSIGSFINQDSMMELNLQLELKMSIYKRAKKVLVWLDVLSEPNERVTTDISS